MKREEFEKRHGRLPDHATYIDLDARVVREPVIAGWTDTQIRNKPLAEIDQMITSADAAIESLQSTVREQQAHADGLRLVRQRKVQLGG